MAKKTKAKDSNVKVNLDELVNEGKSLNETEVNETWKQIVDEIKEPVSNGVELDGDVSTLSKSDVKEQELNDTETAAENSDVMRTMEIPNVVETQVEETTEINEENIDDVIAECTGGVEEKKTKKKKTIKDNESWYVARALRGNDYFNW